LGDKKKDILHCKILKQYFDLGLKSTKIHRGISFKEEPWMKSYIELNTKFRTEASSEFDKDFFKLMNNSVFGKTMENIRNRNDVRLQTEKKFAEKLASKPNYGRVTIFSEHLIAVHMKKNGTCYQQASSSWDVNPRYLKNFDV